MKFLIKVDGKELLDSAVVHATDKDDITIDINGLILKFEFEDDSDDKTTGYRGGVFGNTFTMTLRNFNNVLGDGVLKPLEVGFYKNRKLYLTFFVNTMNNKERRFEYNLFLGGAHE